MPGVFGNQQNQNLDVIKRMLLSALQPTESDALRIQAVKAVGAFILLHDKEPVIQQHFQDVLLPLMQVSSNNDLITLTFEIWLESSYNEKASLLLIVP